MSKSALLTVLDSMPRRSSRGCTGCSPGSVVISGADVGRPPRCQHSVMVAHDGGTFGALSRQSSATRAGTAGSQSATKIASSKGACLTRSKISWRITIARAGEIMYSASPLLSELAMDRTSTGRIAYTRKRSMRTVFSSGMPKASTSCRYSSKSVCKDNCCRTLFPAFTSLSITTHRSRHRQATCVKQVLDCCAICLTYSGAGFMPGRS
mmetsp:Transcript_24270/g.51737  ORF Transcript_24270/g.51737 Transcript_24270/m.51737 type:complete len:209 (+) Transcript_24270:1211-1837(+)